MILFTSSWDNFIGDEIGLFEANHGNIMFSMCLEIGIDCKLIKFVNTSKLIQIMANHRKHHALGDPCVHVSKP